MLYIFLLPIAASEWLSEYESKQINQTDPFTYESNIFISDVTVNHTWWKEKKFVFGHRHRVINPVETFSILEPGYPGIVRI